MVVENSTPSLYPPNPAPIIRQTNQRSESLVFFKRDVPRHVSLAAPHLPDLLCHPLWAKSQVEPPKPQRRGRWVFLRFRYGFLRKPYISIPAPRKNTGHLPIKKEPTKVEGNLWKTAVQSHLCVFFFNPQHPRFVVESGNNGKHNATKLWRHRSAWVGHGVSTTNAFLNSDPHGLKHRRKKTKPNQFSNPNKDTGNFSVGWWIPDTLQGTITYPTLKEKEKKRKKSTQKCLGKRIC